MSFVLLFLFLFIMTGGQFLSTLICTLALWVVWAAVSPKDPPTYL